MVNKRYFIKPIISSTMAIVVCVLFFLFAKYCSQQIDSIAKSIMGINTTFSLTFIAFSIAALALLQLLQTQKWYQEVYDTVEFKSFISRLFLSIYFSFALCALSILQLFVIEIDIHYIKEITISISVFMITFILIWVFDCIREFMRMFR